MSVSFKHLDPASLPADWSADFFGNLVDFKLGKTPPRRNSVYWKEGKYPWVSISDMTPHGVVTETSEKVSQQAYDTVFRGCLVPEGSLLMSFKLTIGRISRLGMPAFHNEAIISFQPDQETLSDDFLRYYLSQINYRDYQDTAIKGQTLNKGKLNSLEIALPPLPEQKKIAYILSTVQRAIEAQERIIQTTTELKKTLLHKLFTEGLRNEPQKQTEIGPIPESWEVVRIKSTGTIVTGSTPSTENPEFYGGSYILISPADLDNGKYVRSAHRTLTKSGFEKCRNIPRDSVLVGCIGNVGKLGMVNNDCSATNQQINSIIPSEDFNPHFLYYALQLCRPKLEQTAAKVTVPILNKSNFENFQITSPSRSDQDILAGHFGILDQKLAITEEKVTILRAIFCTLLHELMTAKTRVISFECSPRKS